MPSFLVQLLLCVSSYFPLLAIFALQFYFKGHAILGIVIMSGGTIGLLGLAIYLRVVASIAPSPFTVTSINRRDGEAMSYIVTYLLPFIAIPSGSLADALSLGIILVVLGVLYMNSDMLHINPMLNLGCWHIYDVTLKNGESRSLISRQRIRKGLEIKAIVITPDILLEVKHVPEHSKQ